MSAQEQEETKSCTRNEILPEWVLALAEDEATQPSNWPPRAKDREIDWDQPTFQVYSDPDYLDFTPNFKQARQMLDYSYHRNPAKSRQALQDVILSRVVQAAVKSNESNSSSNSSSSGESKEEEEKMDERRPWIIFSAGSMGVGKGYVMSTLYERGIFPLDQLLHIDPDKIKTELPEMSGYLQKDAATAATKVHRESTQMADVLLEYALQSRLPTLVDGSLRDVDFYRTLMRRIRYKFPEYQLAILHVTASPEIIRSRAEMRAEKTGRAIPEELLQESIDQVPKSVDALTPFVDVTYTISNEDNQPIQLIKIRHGEKEIDDPEALSWKSFRDMWLSNLDEIQIFSTTKTKRNKRLPSWRKSQCPGVCKMSVCWKDKKCLSNITKAFQKAYPSFCPSCSLGGDMQCGICIHEKHRCKCTECGLESTMTKSGVGEGGCSLTKIFNKQK